MPGRAPHADPPRFVPRVTVMLLGSIAVFMLSTLLYSLPVLLEPVPPEALADYHEKRVAERLEGKVAWFVIGSVLLVALLARKAWLPGTRRP